MTGKRTKKEIDADILGVRNEIDRLDNMGGGDYVVRYINELQDRLDRLLKEMDSLK